VSLDDLTINLNARHLRTAPVAQQPRDLAHAQLRPLRLGGAHQGGRELSGVHLSRRLSRAQLLGEGDLIRNPMGLVSGAAMTCLGADETAIGGQGTVAPLAPDLLREFGVQCEASPCECFERGSVTPIQGQKAP